MLIFSHTCDASVVKSQRARYCCIAHSPASQLRNTKNLNHLRRLNPESHRSQSVGPPFAFAAITSVALFPDNGTSSAQGKTGMASKKNLRIYPQGGVTVLDLGDMEIWDGADLALLRDTLTRLIVGEKCRAVGVNMSYVKYIPSGFFGMLFDWYEEGVRIRLFSPQPNVERMLWFSRFFEMVSEGCHELRAEPQTTQASYLPAGKANGAWESPSRGLPVAGSARR